MRRFVLFAFVLIGLLGGQYAQVRLVYEDDYCDKGNFAADIIEADNGDYVYVGMFKSYGYENEQDSIVRGAITIISNAGKFVNRYIDDVDCEYSRFESVIQNLEGDYIVCGGMSVDDVSYTLILKFDKELNLLWRKEYKVDDRFTRVCKHTVSYAPDRSYFVMFKVYPIDGTDGIVYIAKFLDDGEMIKMVENTIDRYLFYKSSDILLDNTGKLFVFGIMNITEYDLNLNLVDTIEGVTRVYSSSGREYRLFADIGSRLLSDGRIVLGSAYIGVDDDKPMLMIANFDKEKRVISNCKGVGKKETEGSYPLYKVYASEKGAVDFVDESNMIIAGTLNCYCPPIFPRPYFVAPSTLGVVSFGADFKVNWEEYYSDEYSYYMMAMCATKDGGAVALALKSMYDYGLFYDDQYSTVTIFKFRGDDVSVDEVGHSVLKMYPNPAVDQIRVELSEAGSGDDFRLEFYDMTGRLLKTERIYGGTQSVCVSDLKRGVYNVRLVAGETAPERTKIVLR